MPAMKITIKANRIKRLKRSSMDVTTMASAGLSRVDAGRRAWPLGGAALILGLVSLSAPTIASAQAAKVVKVATPQALMAAISAATPGETISLAAGAYGPLVIYNRKVAAPGFTIEAQPGAKATFASIETGDVEGVTFRGLDVDVQTASTGVYIGKSTAVRIERLDIHAPTGKAPNAMFLRFAHDVTVADNTIHNVGMGINFLDSDHLKILRNSFTDLQVDAIRGAASYVDVIGNHATSFHPQNGDHPDFIQFWKGESGPSTNNVIKDNVYERGQGAVVQGIFLEDSKDVEISGNALLGTMYNGISMSRSQSIMVENNFVQGYQDMETRIITRGTSTDVTIRNNVSQVIINYSAGDEPPNIRYKEEHNQSIKPAKIGDTKAMQDWLAKKGGG
jgi:parallel beta-helix repeat protein